jgi:GTP-binding protein Era
MESVDAIVVVIDASAQIGRGDRFVVERVEATGLPFVLLLNKADRVKPKERLLPLIAEMSVGPAVAVVPGSALHGPGLEGLLQELRRLIPEGPAQLPADLATDQTERFMIAELIREKVLDATRQEVPHATTVLVDALRETEGGDDRPRLVVDASLVVEKENQKAILIGRGGQMLKRIGTAARLDLEQQLGVSCRLNLFVKVIRKWREDRGVLSQVFEGSRGVVPGRPTADELLSELSASPPPDDDE